MDSKSNSQAVVHEPTRTELLLGIERRVEHLAERSLRQRGRIRTLEQELEGLRQVNEALQQQIRDLELKLATYGDASVSAPILELRDEVAQLIPIVDACVAMIDCKTSSHG